MTLIFFFLKKKKEYRNCFDYVAKYGRAWTSPYHGFAQHLLNHPPHRVMSVVVPAFGVRFESSSPLVGASPEPPRAVDDSTYTSQTTLKFSGVIIGLDDLILHAGLHRPL